MLKEIDERQNSTLLLLREKKFDLLQKRMDKFLEAYSSGNLTDEELFYHFGAFDVWGASITPLIKEWVRRYPKSFAALHALSLHISSMAWSNRGVKFM